MDEIIGLQAEIAARKHEIGQIDKSVSHKQQQNVENTILLPETDHEVGKIDFSEQIQSELDENQNQIESD